MNPAARLLQQAIVLIGVGLLIGAGACLFDAGEQSGGDVCVALVAVASVPVLPFVLTLAGEITPASDPPTPHFRPDPAAPPPRA